MTDNAEVTYVTGYKLLRLPRELVERLLVPWPVPVRFEGVTYRLNEKSIGMAYGKATGCIATQSGVYDNQGVRVARSYKQLYRKSARAIREWALAQLPRPEVKYALTRRLTVRTVTQGRRQSSIHVRVADVGMDHAGRLIVTYDLID